MDYLGVSLGNYGATALLGALIAQYGVGLALPSLIQGTLSFAGAVLVLAALMNGIYYFYRKNDREDFHKRTEIGLAVTPLLITPLGAIVVGIILWIIGKF